MRLETGDLALDLAPEAGGAIARFAVGGRDVLRPLPSDSRDPLQAGCFPLVPYANRIAGGVFSFRGCPVRLSPNMAGEPHPLHGQAWRGSWAIASAARHAAVLTYRHKPGDGGWPWPYEALQAFTLTTAGLGVRLTLSNTGEEPMPAGLGLHPYFAARTQAALTARVDGVWLTGPDRLPTVHAPASAVADLGAGLTTPPAAAIDNCFTGWDGFARIAIPGLERSVALRASPALRWLHVYAPVDGNFVCAEPVSHRPDAMHAEDPTAQGWRVLEPGARWAVWLRFDLEPDPGARPQGEATGRSTGRRHGRVREVGRVEGSRRRAA